MKTYLVIVFNPFPLIPFLIFYDQRSLSLYFVVEKVEGTFNIYV